MNTRHDSPSPLWSDPAEAPGGPRDGWKEHVWEGNVCIREDCPTCARWEREREEHRRELEKREERFWQHRAEESARWQRSERIWEWVSIVTVGLVTLASVGALVALVLTALL